MYVYACSIHTYVYIPINRGSLKPGLRDLPFFFIFLYFIFTFSFTLSLLWFYRISSKYKAANDRENSQKGNKRNERCKKQYICLWSFVCHSVYLVQCINTGPGYFNTYIYLYSPCFLFYLIFFLYVCAV